MSIIVQGVVLRAHVEGNQIVLDEPYDLPSGTEVTVHLQGIEPIRGSFEAVKRSMGRAIAPNDFDITKINREELFD
jgi:hypothetical protein